VYFEADEALSTLLDLRYRQHYKAEPGRAGQSKGKHGRGGEDLVVRVPVGTAVFFEGEAGSEGERPPWKKQEHEEEGMETVWVVDVEPEAGEEELFERDDTQAPPTTDHVVGDLVGDLTAHGDRLLVVEGGRGGRGNIHFRSSTNRSPDRAEPGTPGGAAWLRLELKLLADVGIVGFPNVGKSTLITRISGARPRVADYPFTTLVPQLGVVRLDSERNMVVADVPGLVKGASHGRGLGHQFLRHLERTRVLLHLLSPDPSEGRNPLDDLDALERELSEYGPMFAGRPRVVALNKIDTPEGAGLLQESKAALRERNIPLFPICALSGQGVSELLEALWRRLEAVRSSDP
jgi:GTP-binding protein